MENLKEQSEVDSILDRVVEGMRIRDMQPMTFCTYCLSFLNEVPAYDYSVQEITRRLNNWTAETMSDSIRLDFIIKLKSMGFYK